MDPWGSESTSKVVETNFEDNFQPAPGADKLNDSAAYIAILERKLKVIKSKSKVEDLAAYRADCIDRLLRDGCDLDPVIGDTEADKLIEDQDPTET